MAYQKFVIEIDITNHTHTRARTHAPAVDQQGQAVAFGGTVVSC